MNVVDFPIVQEVLLILFFRYQVDTFNFLEAKRSEMSIPFAIFALILRCRASKVWSVTGVTTLVALV